MTYSNSITNSIKATLALALVASFASTSFAYAQTSTSAAKVPTCEISVASPSITSAQSTTLSWESTEGALFASVDNNIGDISPDGKMNVSPSQSTVYTMHTWNARGEGSYCSTSLTVAAGGTGGPVQTPTYTAPQVTVQTLAVHPAATRVVLTSVPYTGPVEDALYTFFMLALMLTAGYVATKQRKTIFA